MSNINDNNFKPKEKKLEFNIIAVSIRFLVKDLKLKNENMTDKQLESLKYYEDIADMLENDNTIYHNVDNYNGIIELINVMSNQMKEKVKKANSHAVPSIICAILDWSAYALEGLAQQIKVNKEQGTDNDLFVEIPSNLRLLFEHSRFG